MPEDRGRMRYNRQSCRLEKRQLFVQGHRISEIKVSKNPFISLKVRGLKAVILSLSKDLSPLFRQPQLKHLA